MKLMKQHRFSIAVFASLIGLAGSLQVSAQDADPGFKPELVGVELTSREVRPGDPFGVTLKFRNAGTKPAGADYRVFLHFETSEKSCRSIVIHADHVPMEPTSLWKPGKLVVDGPRLLVAPDDPPEQELYIHVGVYDYGRTGQRLLDTYEGGKIRVTRTAPSVETIGPDPLSQEEINRRRLALATRIPAASRTGLDTARWKFDLDRNSGAWMLTDKKTGVLWTSNLDQPRFGEIILKKDDQTAIWRIDRFDEVDVSGKRLRLVTRPTVDREPTGVAVTFTVEPTQEPAGLKLTYESECQGPWKVSQVRLLHHAMTVTEADGGCIYVPHRLGIEMPAAQGLPSESQWRTYASLSMAMCGLVKQGSALLVNWENVDTQLSVHSDWPDLPLVPGSRSRAVSLEIEGPQGMCSIHPLGHGGYVEIAKAYRLLAEAKGWRKTWAEKRKQFPTVDRFFGAANFKPFVFSRVVPSSRFCRDGKERTHLGFTFEEVAQCAEHWRNDLGIDRADVVMAGWINGGYDVRHPDVLPAAPECGGNQGLAAAIERIKACGYLVGMHDNYQDMYEDAPSWGEEWLNKNSQGVPKKGGNWNGGQAWQVCAIKQVELAARPDTNLPEIARLFHPTIYFIDTVFAWPLVTCEAPEHPMTRWDDLKWKSKLCLLAKKYFGLFGSEEGREWAVPCADYLEGIFGHQTDSAPGKVVPLFPLVYSDCVQIMTHQGNRIGPGDEKKMADHILFAEMMLPQFGSHLYWKTAKPERTGIVPLTPVVRGVGPRKFEITYRWEVRTPVHEDYSVFVHFISKSSGHPEGIAYQNDHAPKVPTSQWRPGIVEDGPYVVEVPEQFTGEAGINVGMLLKGQRILLSGAKHKGLRYDVGTVAVNDDGIRLQPSDPEESTELWSRGDTGWAKDLCVTDRVIKNAWEVLSPLNVITAETPLTSHEFITEDRLVQRTRFGDVTITVAYEKSAQIGDNVVPAYGFVVESPRFIAFCATRYNGIQYPTPTLFTVRSLDNKPIAESEKVRIYHGFGDPRIRLYGKDFEVTGEQIVCVK